MKRLLAGAVAATAIALSLAPADAKTKAATGALTQTDLRKCMGVDGSSHDEQIAACTKIIKSGKVKPPHHGDYYATRGSAYFAKGDLNNALSDMNTAIGIRKAAEFSFQRGLIHMARKNLESAKADMADVIKLKPAFAPAYFMTGLIAYTSADYQDALTNFDSAVQRRPTYFQAIYARGATKKKLGDESGAKKDVAEAVGMSPKVQEEMEKLGLKL
jgi:tetratricopeptide (TPR) repeat protein